MNRRDLLLSAAICIAAPVRPAFAEEVILTLSDTRVSLDIPFTLEALDRLPQAEISTSTPWDKEVHVYSGVTLKTWLELAGQPAATIRLIALNDYVVDADVDWLVRAGALLATRRDGVPMPVRDKGPVFVVFPFDARPRLLNPIYLSRAVWQLVRIEIRS